MSDPLRLGRVSFINTYPVEWALTRHLPEGEAVEVTGVPTALNRMLRAGEQARQAIRTPAATTALPVCTPSSGPPMRSPPR